MLIAQKPRILPLLVAIALVGGAASAGPEPGKVSVSAEPITRFHIGSDVREFGALEFVGGMELRSAEPLFGSISGFRFRDGDGRFVAVADTGHWLFGRIGRDEEGRPVSVDEVSIQPVAKSAGSGSYKKQHDAESLELRGDTAIVGFEQQHRIALFDLDGDSASEPAGRIDPLIPLHEIRANAGFEALAGAPQESPLAGALVVITERSLDADGNLFAAILEGPEKGLFRVRRHGGYDVTDSVFLPGGDLILLERSFSLMTGVRMRIRRIALDDIRRDALVDGTVLLEANLRHQIDNMEAIDAWRDSDGQIRLAVLSDDNHSFLQRTLYLEFRFIEASQ